jgi:hypothetical protein
MDTFKKATGKDTWFTLVSVLNAYLKAKDKKVLDMLIDIMSVCDFDTAAQLFYSVIKQGESGTPLDEIRDGMHRVGYRPVQREDSDMCQPWPLLLIVLAQKFDSDLADVIDVKKK